jgi:rhomboid protease GluP
MGRESRSMLCPNCRLLISRDEPRCPYCGIARPAFWQKTRLVTDLLDHPSQLLKNIIYINMAMYFLSLALNPWTHIGATNPFALLSPSSQSLLLLGATGTYPIDGLHRWWTLLSANYLHGGIMHILFNMIALWQLAPLVFREFGVHRMFLIYTLGGVGGYILSYLAGVNLTIGASAALCALIGASLYFGASRGGAYAQTIFRNTAGWAVMIFLFGFLVPGINNWAHGGGIVSGFILGFILGYADRGGEKLFHKILSAVCAVLTLAVLIWAVVTALYLRFFI